MNARLPFLPFATLLFFTVVAAAPVDEALERRVLTLTGNETVRIPATRARLTIIVEHEAENPATAQQLVAKRSNTVLDFLQSSKVDRLQAGAMTLHPVYGPAAPPYDPRRTTEVTGYRAQWHATFEIDAEQAGRIVDGAVAAGATRVTNFEFTATESDLANAQREALRQAALRAREDANAILQALDYKPAEVEEITVNSGSPIMPLGRRVEAMSATSSEFGPAPTAVEPGFVEVTGSVTLKIGY